MSVGNAGPTKAVIAEVERALAKHELIKVRIQGDDRELRKQIGDDIAAATDAAVVHRVGKVVICSGRNRMSRRNFEYQCR